MTMSRTAALAALFVLLGACSPRGEGGTVAPPTAASVVAGNPAGEDATGTPEGAVRVIDASATGGHANAVFTDGSALWLGGANPGGDGGRVVKVDLEGGRVAWSVKVPDDVAGLALAEGGVLFVTGGGDGADPTGGVTRLDTRSGRVLGTLTIPDGSPYGVAAAPGRVWVTDARSDRVWRLDPKRGTVQDTVRVARSPTAVSSSPTGNDLWVASPEEGVVTHLDAATGTVRGTISVANANSLAVTPSAVWVGGSTLTRLDPETGAKEAEIPTRGPVLVDAVTDGWVWGHEAKGQLIRGTAEGLRLDPRPISRETGDFVATRVAGDRLFVYEPDRNRIVEWKLPLPSGFDFPAEQPREGVNFGFIRAVDDKEVTFDPAEELTGTQATDVAARDGASAPSGFYDRNRDGDTHRLRFGPKAALVVLEPGSGGVPTPVEVDRPAFGRAVATVSGPYRLIVQKGVVTRAEQVYRP